MSTRERILEFASEIVRRYAPEKIILFGSQARGEANEDSDVDMLLLMEFEGYGADKGADILSAINPRLSVDLVVRRPIDVKRRLEQHDQFLREIFRDGIVLYEAGN